MIALVCDPAYMIKILVVFPESFAAWNTFTLIMDCYRGSKSYLQRSSLLERVSK